MKKNLFLILSVIILSLMLPVFASSMDYNHKLEMDDMQFSSTIEGDKIHVKLTCRDNRLGGKNDILNPAVTSKIMLAYESGRDSFKKRHHHRSILC
ncbi:MAG: hypothetical protein PF690_08750 [Deltaproteobacteria bacterium]|jgi:hypothetical protein|nr:hypothetical protein [Deltaproteobacteria bacterium]